MWHECSRWRVSGRFSDRSSLLRGMGYLPRDKIRPLAGFFYIGIRLPVHGVVHLESAHGGLPLRGSLMRRTLAYRRGAQGSTCTSTTRMFLPRPSRTGIPLKKRLEYEPSPGDVQDQADAYPVDDHE